MMMNAYKNEIDTHKITIIYGEKPFQTDKQVESFGEISQESYHVNVLLDFARKVYPKATIFQKLNYKHPRETVAFFLLKYFNHVIFLNTTSDIEKYGKTGVFILPNQLTPIQEESLLYLADQLEDYTDIMLSYDLQFIDGIIEDKTIISNGNKRKLVQKYLDQIHEKNLQK